MNWLRIAVFFLCSYQADAKGQKIGVMADAGQQQQSESVIVGKNGFDFSNQFEDNETLAKELNEAKKQS